MEEQNRMAHEEFVTRLGSLPVVNSAWTQACTLYQKTKDSNAVFRTALNVAEGTVKTFTETSKPYVEKYQPQIEKVNEFAYQQLVKLEENYPVITKPTDELISDGKEVCKSIAKPAVDRVNAVKQYGTDTYNGVVNRGKERIQKVKKFGTDTVNSVKDLGMATVNRTLETSYGQFMKDKMDDVLDISEDYIDKYLPDAGEEEEIEMDNLPKESEMNGEMDEASLENPIIRASHLTTKVRKRMYRRAVRDLKNVQMRSKEALSKLNFTVNLISYARENMESAKNSIEEKYDSAQSKISYIWTEITSDKEDEQKPETLEEQTIAVARQLTQQLKHGVETVTGYLPESVQPASVYERIQHAKKYTEDLYHSFRDVKTYDEIPKLALSQAKEKLSYLQETLQFVTEMLITAPLQWLVPHKKEIEVEME